MVERQVSAGPQGFVRVSSGIDRGGILRWRGYNPAILSTSSRSTQIDNRNPLAMRVAFGDFVFDSDTRELLCGGNRVTLSPKAFQLTGSVDERYAQSLSGSEKLGL